MDVCVNHNVQPNILDCGKVIRYLQYLQSVITRDRAGLRQCRHLRFLISFGDKIRPLAIFGATFYLSKITSYCCQSTAQVNNIVC